MSEKNIKKSIFARVRNNFIAGIVVLIPIGITLYLTLFLIRISGKIIPREINPNNYLPFDIPGVEILMALIIITFTGWLSLSFLGKKFFEIFNNILKKIPILRTIYSAIGQMTESLTKTDNSEKSTLSPHEPPFVDLGHIAMPPTNVRGVSRTPSPQTPSFTEETYQQMYDCPECEEGLDGNQLRHTCIQKMIEESCY